MRSKGVASLSVSATETGGAFALGVDDGLIALELGEAWGIGGRAMAVMQWPPVRASWKAKALPMPPMPMTAICTGDVGEGRHGVAHEGCLGTTGWEGLGVEDGLEALDGGFVPGVVVLAPEVALFFEIVWEVGSAETGVGWRNRCRPGRSRRDRGRTGSRWGTTGCWLSARSWGQRGRSGCR